MNKVLVPRVEQGSSGGRLDGGHFRNMGIRRLGGGGCWERGQKTKDLTSGRGKGVVCLLLQAG